MVSNLSEYGNTSAASIPLALDGAVRDGSIKKGDVVRSPYVWVKQLFVPSFLKQTSVPLG